MPNEQTGQPPEMNAAGQTLVLVPQSELAAAYASRKVRLEDRRISCDTAGARPSRRTASRGMQVRRQVLALLVALAARPAVRRPGPSRLRQLTGAVRLTLTGSSGSARRRGAEYPAGHDESAVSAAVEPLVDVMWRGTDALGHVSNAVSLTCLEEGRDVFYSKFLGDPVYVVVRFAVDS
jgi:hypothetical protein